MNKYLQILDDAWQLHLEEKPINAPTVISLFAGCGGSSLGYSMAGFKELLAVEWDNNAVETFKLNFPDIPVYHGDIANLSVEETLSLTNLQPGELDVLDGSPPCQGFSTAGKRIMQDSRNFLFREFSRLLKGLQPKVFIMENVSGMVKGKMKLIFAEILRELKSCGYKVKAVLMNAMYFNVPQSRQRMIFCGVREDLEIEPGLPKPQNKPITVFESIGAKGSFWNSSFKWKIKKSTPFATFTKTKSKSHQIKSGCGIRFITIEEMKKAASYPLQFKILDFTSGLIRIGNSVPPLFMKAIAEHIRTEILDKDSNARTN